MTDNSKRGRAAETRVPEVGPFRGEFMACMRRFARDRGGAGAILFAFALPAMIGAIGLGIEVGM